MHVTRTIVVVAPPTLLPNLPRRQLAEYGYFLAGVASARQAIKAAEVFLAEQILVDSRVVARANDTIDELRSSPATRNAVIYVCDDCTSWSTVAEYLNGEQP